MTFSKRLHQMLSEKSQEERFSGAVLIKQSDRELFKAAYGFANRSWRIPNQVDTRFRIASISKMFTAVAILQLIDANKLTPETSVVDFLTHLISYPPPSPQS